MAEEARARRMSENDVKLPRFVHIFPNSLSTVTISLVYFTHTQRTMEEPPGLHVSVSPATTRRLGTAYFQSGVGVAHANQLQYLLRFLSHFPCLFHSIFLRNLPEHFCIFNYLTNTTTRKFYVYARRPTVCATTAQEDDLTLESLSTLLPQYSTHKRTCGTGFSKSKIDTIIRE